MNMAFPCLDSTAWTWLRKIADSFIPPVPLVFIAILMIILSDYRAYISLGPGGTPSTPAGYLRIKLLGLFACKNPYKPIPTPSHFIQKAGILKRLPKRLGDRPSVRGIAPHRQVDQKAPPQVFAHLRAAIEKLAEQNQSHLIQKTSCLEKHGPGLFVRNARHLTPHCSGEACHAHPSDGSLHLTLHPADAQLVLESGWGERHPLGNGGWLSRFVPRGFLMAYAPRTEKEVEIVLRIVLAAVWWIGAVEIDDKELKVVRDGVVSETEQESRWPGACLETKPATVLQ